MNLKYRADIDGLRAIAVLAVLGYHTNLPGFSGGFVGVDIFFVISGFLITSVILKDIQAGKFSIALFYERRIRRIFPALFPVILFTLVIGALLFDYKDFKDLGQSVSATTLFSSNILLWQRKGYFDAASIQNPLLHTWSLAVEEQFYIFFPIILYAISRFLKKKYLLWLVAIGVLSLAASIYGVQASPKATFYLMPTRAWELAVGSILALGVIPAIKSRSAQNALTLVGLALVCFSVGFYTEATPFPGYAAIVPVLGAFLIMYGGEGSKAVLSGLLGKRPVVFVGLISYSLYLWHWPLIVFAKYIYFYRELNPFEIAAILLAAFALATLSLKFIEKPFRGATGLIGDRRSLFALSTVVLLCFSLAGAAVYVQNGLPSRQSVANTAIMKADDRAWWDKTEKDQEITARLSQGGIPPRLGADKAAPSFIVWGDSHAQAMIPVFDEMAKKAGVAGFVTAIGGRPPLLGLEITDRIVNNVQVNQGILDFVAEHPELKTAIIAGYWNWYIGHLKDMGSAGDLKKQDIAILKDGLTRTVNSLLALGRKVIIVSDIPDVGFDVLRDRYFSLVGGERYRSLPTPTIDDHRRKHQAVDGILRELARLPNVTLITPDSLLFDHDGRVITMANHEMLYKDATHLTKYGAYFVGPAFSDFFGKPTTLQ